MSSDTGDLLQQVLDLRIELGILNDRVATACGLRPSDLDVLDVIEREGPCTPTHLCARTGIHAATMTGVLARLKADGWIERAVSSADGRSSTVTSTAQTAELREIYDAADDRIARHAAALSPAQRSVISDFLRQVGLIARETAGHIALRPGGSGREPS